MVNFSSFIAHKYSQLKKAQFQDNQIFEWFNCLCILLIRSSFIIKKFISFLNPKADRRGRFLLPHLPIALNRILQLRFSYPSSSSSSSFSVPLQDLQLQGPRIPWSMASLNFTQIKTKNPIAELALSRSRTGLTRRNRVGFRVLAAGEAQAEPDLSVTVNGLHMPNPFVIGSGPPGTNYTVMKRAFDEGWGAVIAKTVSSVAFDFVVCWFCLVTEKADGKIKRSLENICWKLVAYDEVVNRNLAFEWQICCCQCDLLICDLINWASVNLALFLRFLCDLEN